MRLVIGLGNPDKKYINTRHNVGFLVVDKLQDSKNIKGVVIKKSDTFMNNSGDFVEKEVNRYKTDLNDLFIIHDDLDLRLGLFKIQFGTGPKSHNGLRSIDGKLGSDQYWHVRVGVDNRVLEDRTEGEKYVLQEFTNEEQKTLESVVSEVASELCKKLQTS